jgi:hypothetical protein
MFDSPENNVFEGTVGYSAMTAASGSAQPYLNFAAGFDSVTAQRYFTTAVDSAYFYGSGAGDQFNASSASVTMAFGIASAQSSEPTPSAIANGFDYAIAYDYNYPNGLDNTGRGEDVGVFVDGLGNDVFYATSTYAYMSGPSPFIAGRGYFNAVFAFSGAHATSAGGGADTAYLLDAVHNSATGFANVIT